MWLMQWMNLSSELGDDQLKPLKSETDKAENEWGQESRPLWFVHNSIIVGSSCSIDTDVFPSSAVTPTVNSAPIFIVPSCS